ncbi:DUF916 domain-containing protein [Cellulomonas oligotrophica]|uniref:DUF916 domain-containing protein n=1 Tax=Cellulomonas oligotrophica TaxID=931536 RepID=A0A7Y9FHW4_9CELL|nr:DUF916 domain-containing protein [Cellulomonas oligotrophica]NYD87609.1 hypothetical protein [Cellulomonas oligotrophica]GIG33486.1 hypothetical protein Col01nite_26450 [Cellulomonas oligotrophica]
MPRTVPPTPVRALLVAAAGSLAAALALAAPAAATVPATTTTTTTTTTSGDGAVSWGVRPAAAADGSARANFVYEVEPGDVVDDVLVVTNHGADPLTLDVYAADAFTTPSGALDLLAPGTPSTDLGTWVRVDRSSVDLAPGAEVEVPFVVEVPADARPGDHAAGVVTSLRTSQPGQTVQVDRRMGARVHVRVAGEAVPAVAARDGAVEVTGSANPFAPTAAFVTYTVENTGDTRLAGTAAVRVAGPGGAAAVEVVDELPELLPGDVLVRQVQVDGVWPLGRARADVDVLVEGVGLGAGSAEPRSLTATTWAVPWAQVLLLGAAVGLGLLLPRLSARAPRPGP